MASTVRTGREYGLAVTVIGLTLLLGLAVRSRFTGIDIAMLLLLGVVVVAALTRRGPAILSAILATTAFDFFFVPPYGTLAVQDSAYLVTLVVMLIVAVVMGGLTARIREGAEAARERERQVVELFALSRDLARETALDRVTSIARTHLGRAVRGEVELVLAGTAQFDPYKSGYGVRVFPVWPDWPQAGIIKLTLAPEGRTPTDEERRTVRLLLDQVAVALERIDALSTRK